MKVLNLTIFFIVIAACAYTQGTGNVGIGTTTPLQKLDVNGNINVRGNNIFAGSAGRLRLHGGGGTSGYVEIQTMSPGYGLVIREYNSGDFGNIEVTDAGLGLGYKTSGIHMVIDPAGNIGVGTTTPTVKLDVNGDINVQGNDIYAGTSGRLRLVGGGGTSGYVEAQTMSPDYGFVIREYDGSAFGNIEVTENGLGIGYHTSDMHMTIGTAGNVGIGTASPTEKLTVSNGHVSVTNGYGLVKDWGGVAEYAFLPVAAGLHTMTGIGPHCPGDRGSQIRSDRIVAFVETDQDKVSGWFDLNNNRFIWNGLISSREIIVQTDVWADYVFDENYQLKSLKEIGRFINKNGHLPNVPSQEEVVESGIDVSKMTVIQQEKIEELFLHMIEMDKRMETLEKRNEQLEQENKELKSKRAQPINPQN